MMRKPGAHIAVTAVRHRYRRQSADALSDINLEIQPCEAAALVGRSGCGKSTLLHIISGLTKPSSGEVRIDGALVDKPSPRWIVMFQRPSLYPWMTVSQSVGLGMRFAGRPRREIRERVGELLRLVELEDYGDRNVQELSGGQQQRVALARSLAVRPEVLLLDEPFSSLDAVTRRALQRDVRRIATEIGITLITVTHDIAEAVVMADRAFVMRPDPGRIAEIVPIDGDRRDSAQVRLQTAFERASGQMVEQPVPDPSSSVTPLRIAVAGSR